MHWDRDRCWGAASNIDGHEALLRNIIIGTNILNLCFPNNIPEKFTIPPPPIVVCVCPFI